MLYITAFGAGLASFFSPCVLPIIPGYLSWISGYAVKELTAGERPAAVKNTLFFSAGFSLAFSLMGAAASSLGEFLNEHRFLLLKIMGAAVFVLGLHIAGIIKLRFLYYEKKIKVKKTGYFGSFLVGLAFAVGWSPCIGPFLAGALALAAKTGHVFKGTLLLFIYSLGIALPFLAAAMLTGKFIGWVSAGRKVLVWIERAAGAVLAILGALMFFDKLMFL